MKESLNIQRRELVKADFLSNAERTELFKAPYPNYPERRFFAASDDIPNPIPAGQWATDPSGSLGHALPTKQDVARYTGQGLQVDALGRPLHPWLPDMASSTNIGVVTGRGNFWNWGGSSVGDNETADPIALVNNGRATTIALIQRGDTGRWALPGGFVDKGEPSNVAAAREMYEEAGLQLQANEATQVYNGIVADTRTTAHAWPHTTAWAWLLNEQVELKPDYAEVKDAQWFDVSNMPLTGTHRLLVQFALQDLMLS